MGIEPTTAALQSHLCPPASGLINFNLLIYTHTYNILNSTSLDRYTHKYMYLRSQMTYGSRLPPAPRSASVYTTIMPHITALYRGTSYVTALYRGTLLVYQEFRFIHITVYKLNHTAVSGLKVAQCACSVKVYCICCKGIIPCLIVTSIFFCFMDF